MKTVRRRVQVIGPGPRGFLIVQVGSRPWHVAVDLIPPDLRLPNRSFVALIRGGEVVAVEPRGEVWLTIQDRIRAVLNAQWDPIGVAGSVDDEYDGYIAELYELLRLGTPADGIAECLSRIEVESMGFKPPSRDRLLPPALALRALELPDVEPP